MIQYFVIQNGQQAGPFTKDQLRQQQIKADTQVWHQGLVSWVRAGDQPDLADLFVAPPPPPPPPPPIITAESTSYIVCFYCQSTMKKMATHCATCRKLRKDIREDQLAWRWLAFLGIAMVTITIFLMLMLHNENKKPLEDTDFEKTSEYSNWLIFTTSFAIFLLFVAAIFARRYTRKMRSKWVT